MRISFGRPTMGKEEIAAVTAVLKKNRTLTNGGKVREFEEKFADLLGGGQAAAVSSCTAGLHIALIALGIGRGDEVIVPALTFVASAHAVEAVGAKVVFADVWPGSGVVDPACVERAITRKTKAIMVVHYAGRPCYMGSILAIARKHNLKVIEDAATSLGAYHSGKHCGLLGDVGVFSFHPVKHISTGEGGMVVSTNPELMEKIVLLREFGKAQKNKYSYGYELYDVTGFGLNFRMTEMQGAIGCCQLDKLEKHMKRRRTNMACLSTLLSDFTQLDLGGDEGAAYCLVVKVPDNCDRNDVRQWMAQKFVETSVYYPGPVTGLTYYKRKVRGSFPHAEMIAQRTIALSVGPHLDLSAMHYTAEVFQESVNENRTDRRGRVHRPSPRVEATARA
jgi:perosamine synthetase